MFRCLNPGVSLLFFSRDFMVCMNVETTWGILIRFVGTIL